MSIEIKVPALPESVSEATVASWHKKKGEGVGRDENVVDLETDKVMLEVPAVADGTITKILKEEGDTVVAGDVLAILEEGEAAGADDKKAKPDKKEADDDADASDDEPKLSPAVRKLLKQHDIDPSDVTGTGKKGRILKEDVQKHVESLSSREAKKADEKKADAKPAAASSDSAPSLPSRPTGERIEQRVAMTRIRSRIAERLIEAQQNAAMLTTFNEVDLQAVMDIRARYKDAFEKKHETKLGMMSFFVKATIEALRRYPIVNASVDGNDIIYHGYYDIGIAVSSPRGLVVPILRDADQLSMAEIEAGIRDFGMRARDNKLTMEDLTGGTFSITNGGVFGSMMSTPILNPPQSAILGMHGITERPVVVDGEIKIRPMMYLAMTYDHRIIDGRDAVMSLRTIKEVLEDPARLFLEI